MLFLILIIDKKLFFGQYKHCRIQHNKPKELLMTQKQNQQNTQESKFSWKTTNTILISIAALLTVLSGCKKEKLEPDTPNTTKTYTYYYDENGILMDTLMAHTNVDTFYVVPKTYDLFATASENNIHNVKNHLDNCTRHNPKTHGKGKFRAKNASIADSTWLANFGYDMSR